MFNYNNSNYRVSIRIIEKLYIKNTLVNKNYNNSSITEY